MIQFYFLSIVTNLLGGLALLTDAFEEKAAFVAGYKVYMARPAFKLTVAFVTLISGIFKLLSVTYGDVRVVGDLFPALTGVLIGWILLLEYYRERTTVSSDTLITLEKIFVKNKSAFGIAGVIAAVLHFFLPGVLFL